MILVSLLSASLLYGAAPIASPTAPAPPQVAPIISGDYSTDFNGNRINDALEFTEGTQGDLSVASAGEMVAVELVFYAPITQRQIDDFLRLGGQITYIYKAVSYGWNGSIPRESIELLPAAMGPTLAQVEPVQRVVAYMDIASQTGRVRPIWKAGFAGSQTGLSGNPNTTIAFVGGGVDAKHADLAGRCVYWSDFSDDKEPLPVDFDGHETMVAGVATGTGQAGGAGTGTLRYTHVSTWPYYSHMVRPITLPASDVTIDSKAYWSGINPGILAHYTWTRGTGSDNMAIVGNNFSEGSSPQTLTNTFTPSDENVFAVGLVNLDRRNLENVVIVTSVSSYPGVGDGFNKFRGVAPGCNWAAAKVLDRDGYAESDQFTAAIDDLVVQRIEKNIKLINISYGLEDWLGFPKESVSLRDKINSVVHNGIIVVAAAGNNAAGSLELIRKMADPARAAQAITVGATNDNNTVTGYSTYGFFSPRTNSGEDFKPDLVAPGGSIYYSAMMAPDSGSSDGIGADREPNDYTNTYGTSFSAPFVAGSAALVIQAMEQQGVPWDFSSAQLPQFVKMLLCATASETNARREGADKGINPTLNRAAGGPNAFPPGKDQHEGYGLINPDAAVEAVRLTYTPGTTESVALGGNASAKRVWARLINLKAGSDVDFILDNPTGADFDLYLYSMTPSDTGTPVILASSTVAGQGKGESLQYLPPADAAALLVIKRISGSGTATLRSTQAGPPTALDLQVSCGLNASTTITLKATDDGRPNPPGAIRYTILSLPARGRLERTDGTAITSAPTALPVSTDKVVYRPPTDWLGQDSFTFQADDGGTPPFGGASNAATVTITVVREVTLEYQVIDSADDASRSLVSGTEQMVTERRLYVGTHATGLRFRNITLPKGATITRATLKISCVSDYWGTAPVDGILRGEAADAPASFGPTTRIVSQLPTTKAATAWKWTASEPWTKNAWYESPDLSGIIQEIVDRPQWSTGNAVVIVYSVGSVTQSSPESDRAFWSYDADPTAAAKLTITYQP